MLDALIINFLKSVVSLLIVVDPLGNIPIFLGITSKLSSSQRRRAFNIAVLTGFTLLIAFAALGDWVLRIFDIELYSFRIAGGGLLLFIALELLVKTSYEARAYNPEQAGAVPLGVPLLVGPGAITTVIIILKTFGIIVAVSSVIVVATATWIILRLASPIHEALGEVGATVISKVMAMLLAAIAVQYILEGVREYLEKIH
ncbi:MAG TPA: MarC family protein [Nitrososphaeria archaeon]|nr:MarC family protein [Nitrososphaeria archaeon]